jgi:hypothetical protein
VLDSVVVAEENRNMILEEGILYSHDKTRVLLCCPGIYDEIPLAEETITIEPYAFYYCNLKKVIPNDNLQTIGNYAFAYSKIQEIVTANNLLSVGSYAFYECTELVTARFSRIVKTIGSYCFYGDLSLTDIYIGESIKTIEQYSFYNCEAISNLIVPESVTTIKTYAFYKAKVQHATLPNLISIADYAFDSAMIEFMDLRDASVTTYGNYCYNNATIETLFLQGEYRARPTLGQYTFQNVKIDELNIYLVPKAQDSYYCWSGAIINKANIYDLKDWLASYDYTGSYSSSY